MTVALQSLLRLVYPPACVSCGTFVEEDGALCSTCWRETPFISGPVCECCGVPLPGAEPGEICDVCRHRPPGWARGRAALLYRGTARSLILRFKHGDREDLARPLGRLLARAAAPLVAPGMVVVPVPLHWARLVARRFNQAALLAAEIARAHGLAHLPDALERTRRTRPQEGMDRATRLLNQQGSMALRKGRAAGVNGRAVLLVDDVMTTGATLSAAAEALRAGGASEVRVAALARVSREE